MADFLFDGPNKIIAEPTGTGNTTYEVGRDIYSAWKRWLQLGTNATYAQAFTVEGGTPIGTTGITTGATFVLINGWKVQAADYDHQLYIAGNLYSNDNIPTIPSATANTTVIINTSTSVTGISNVNLSAIESAKLDELWKLAGLDKNNPLVVDPAARTAGNDINQDITKDSGTDTVTVTRNSTDPDPGT
jgi:hypothetical protein